jgi:hypothetical protein
VHAVILFKSPRRDTLVWQLFDFKPYHYLSNEFFAIVNAIGECGTIAHGKGLAVIVKELTKNLKSVKPEQDPSGNLRNNYRTIITAVVNAGIKIRERSK